MPTIMTTLCHPRALPRRAPSLVLVLASLVFAFWPLAPWYLKRLTDGSDDPLGPLALVAAGVMMWFRRGEIQASTSGCITALTLICSEMVLHHRLPPLLEAGLAVAAVCAVLALPQRHAGIAMLLVLSLPVVASMQFYLGYPLRLAAALITQGTMRLAGCDVLRIGTDLIWHGAQVGVDPPCSGVRMLWVALFVAAALAARSGISWRRLLILVGAAVSIVVLANAARAALLFPSEAGVMPPISGMHDAAGVIVMLPAFFLLSRLHDRLATGSPHLPPAAPSPGLAHALLAVIGLGAACGMVRAFDTRSLTAPRPKTSVVWPETFGGQMLERLPLTPREDAFADAFPGALARFRCGQAELILRSVAQPTRRLHSSRDCLRAAGYDLQNLPLEQTDGTPPWSCFLAVSGDRRLRVKEQITSQHHESWTDVSAWFWSATMHPDHSPWLAATFIEPE